MSKKRKNVFNLLDISLEKVEEMKRKSKLDSIDYVSFDTFFNEKGFLEYGLFKTKQNGRTMARIMRLFRVKVVSNDIRTQINNEEAFKNILNQFGKKGVSFMNLYAYKPGENLIVGYGLVMEGPESQLKQMEEESAYYIRALEDKFRSAYSNIVIESIALAEEWLFEGFFYDNVSVVRGVPKPDPSMGARTGSNPYSTAPQMGRQVSEILLKGMTANKQGAIAEGYPFLMYSILDRLEYEEIERALFHIQNTLSKLASSREYGVSENENFSFPMLFGFGFGEMMGQSHSDSMGESNSTGVSNSEAVSKSVGNSDGLSKGTSHTNSEGTNSSIGDSKTKTEGGGGNVGINIGISDGYNWSQSHANGETSSHGDSQSKADGTTSSFSKSTSETHGLSNTQGMSETKGISASQTTGNSQSQSSSGNISGGVSGGEGSGISRRQVDHFFDLAIEIFMKNEIRFQRSLRDGMYDTRTFILTKNKQSKVTAEELIKESYIDNESPFPVRVLEVEKEEEKVLKKYAKTLAKPKAPEKKPVIPERYKYSTYITPRETTAYNLPQENLPGYNSSIDPIPKSIFYMGKMEQGAVIGNQINPNLNLESPTEYTITEDKIGHIGIFGATNQGKTVFTQKYISSLHNAYGINFLLFDWTRNHRSLIGHLKDKQKFRYNSFESGFFQLRVNLVAPPPGVSPYIWNPVVAELLCYSMGLGDRSFRIITKVLRTTQEKAEERGITPTMEHFVRQLSIEYERRAMIHAAGDRASVSNASDVIRKYTKFMPSNEQQSFGSMIERMEEWLDPNHPVYKSMCGKGRFVTVEELIAGDFVHLIECAHLPSEVRQFVINGITAAIFQYCKCRDIKLKKKSCVMFEEAHTVLQTPTGNEPLNINETIFDTINREGRNYNLIIGYILQSPQKLPPLIFDNLPIRVVFQLPDEDGKRKIVSAGGKDPIRLDTDLVKWVSRQPMGVCLIRIAKFTKIEEGEFVAVKVHMLPTDEISNQLFRKILEKARKEKSVS